MPKNKPESRFYVEGRMAIIVGLEISAKNLEEAQEKAKGLNIENFVDILGDHNDSNFRVSGVFESKALEQV